MPWRRLCTICVVIALFCYGGWRFWYHFTGGFAPNTIHTYLPYDSERAVSPLSDERQKFVEQALMQPYTYLGKGAQCFAFISRDGKYVLKFFKSKHHKLNIFAETASKLPFFREYFEDKIVLKKKQLSAIFEGYLLAYQHLNDESGLLYLHLNNTNELNQSIRVYDGFGMMWPIDLDSTIFVLQHYCTTVADTLEGALTKKDLLLAKKRLNQLVDMYFFGYYNNVYDKDHAVFRNSGFAKEMPIHLDLGHLTKLEDRSDEAFLRKDMDKVMMRMKGWIDKKFPLYSEVLIKEMEEYIENKFDEYFRSLALAA